MGRTVSVHFDFWRTAVADESVEQLRQEFRSMMTRKGIEFVGQVEVVDREAGGRIVVFTVLREPHGQQQLFVQNREQNHNILSRKEIARLYPAVIQAWNYHCEISFPALENYLNIWTSWVTKYPEPGY